MTYMDACLNERNSLNKDELEWVIYNFNNTRKVYDKGQVLHKLFEKQVEKSVNKVAAIYQNQCITYEELNQKANQLARKLREYGVKQNDIVGLMVHRSIDMLVGIIGVLKAGGCYLPIDPYYPQARISFMLEDSETGILLTQKQLLKNMNYTGEVICLDDEELYVTDGLNMENINLSSDLAYVIYTSGSTGKPKGVMLEHCAVHNFIIGMAEQIDFSPEKTIVCLTTISFDIFVLESILPLLMGMKIVIADPMQLSKYLNHQAVDMLQTTPSTMQLILNDQANINCIKDLSDIMLGGEAFPKKLFYELKKYTSARIYNMYGPTETTVWSAIKELTCPDDITIGKPIANTQIYIVDDDNNPLGINSIGELCIAGDGLARGYLNRPHLTSERFAPNPAIQGQKMYKTGDMAKWLQNGEIEFLGRKDSQVKIRGFRIELGEIEDCLGKYERIKECVVAAKENEAGEKYLVAYYISGDELPVSAMISFLKESLPEYMIPGFYIRMERMPLTPNHKTDRNALPKPDMNRPNLDTEYIAPGTGIENHISSVWRQVLNRELVGIRDNFFELGGNSILVSQLYLELEKQYPGKLSLVDIFAYPSISRLAKFIEDRGNESGLCRTIQTLKLPNEFCTEHGNAADKIVLKGSMGKDICNKLDKLSEASKVSVQSIFLSAYMYLLAEVSGQEKIQVFAMIGDVPNYELLNLDFSDTADLIELCRLVDERLGRTYPELKYTEGDLRRIIVKEKHFLPVFYFEQSGIGLEIRDGGLAMHLRRKDSGLLISMCVNARSLQKKSFESLMVNYLDLLKAISENN